MVKISSALNKATRGLVGRRRPLLEAGSDRSAVRAREDYVKAIYQLGEHGPVRAADVVRHVGVSAVSVSKAKKHLERDGLIEVADVPGNLLVLTARGRQLAVSMVRRHRLLETFLHRSLGIAIDQIHAEAERIEHVISEDIAERLAAMLGNPEHDPHGHPIPSPTSDVLETGAPSLTDVAAGADVCVISLDDRDADVVRTLAKSGVLPGLRASVTATGDDVLHLRTGAREISLSAAEAGAVRVSVLERSSTA